jgi:hypothetical protein
MRNPLGLVILVLGLCCATAAEADTIRITSGVVQTSGPLGRPFLISDEDEIHLAAPGVSIAGTLVDVRAMLEFSVPPATVAPGALFDASRVLRVETAHFTARFNNVSGFIPAPFTMTFDASPMRVVCGDLNGFTDCSGSAPFAFQSDLTFSPFEGPPVVHHLVGGGTVEGRLTDFTDFQFGSVRYNFEVSPTPEPTTLSLFAVGAVIAGGRAWRAQRGARNQ